jgi:hypothetical protein
MLTMHSFLLWAVDGVEKPTASKRIRKKEKPRKFVFIWFLRFIVG